MPLNTHYSVVPSYAEAVAEKSWIPVWAEPIYTTQVTLNVSKPSDNERYQRTYEISPQPRTFPVKGSLASTSRALHRHLPHGWRECVHPEGLPFYYHDDWHVITDNEISNSQTLALLTSAYNQASVLTTALGCDWASCDLVLRAERDDDCYYYVVDHANRRVFWLHDTCSETLGLQEAASDRHLDHLLTEEYWTHVEFFPRSVPNLQKAIMELQTALGYGMADHISSDSSTFPYDEHKCREILRVLQTPGFDEVHLTWVTGRFSATIARHRFDTFFGEQYARLGRDQRRLFYSAPQPTFVTKVLSAFVFRTSEAIHSELELLYVDNIVYTIHWRKFIAARLADWAECSILSMGLMALAFAGSLLSKTETARTAGFVTAILAFGALIGSTALRRKYSNGEKLHAADVCDHIRALDHPRYGYRISAAMFALPRALQVWALLGFGAQLVLCALDVLGPLHALIVCATSTLVLILLCIMASVLSREPTQPPGDGVDGRSAWVRLVRACFGAGSSVKESPA